MAQVIWWTRDELIQPRDDLERALAEWVPREDLEDELHGVRFLLDGSVHRELE